MASIALLFSIGVCCAQPSDNGLRSYTFEEMKNLLHVKGYEVWSVSWLAEKFPRVALRVRGDEAIPELFSRWIAGLKVKDSMVGKNILLSVTDDLTAGGSLFADLVGNIVNDKQQPIPGVTISVMGTGKGTVTDEDGNFRLPVGAFDTRVVVSCIGYAEQKIVLSNKSRGRIRLEEAQPESLDAIVVIPYGSTSKRQITISAFTTSGMSSINDPGGNCEDWLKAKVPGVLISEINGVSGSSKVLIIGGVHSLQQNNDPLYVVDGVPLARDGFLPPIGSGSAQGVAGTSALNFIALDNIESITVLKDAAATAIYGSRGSNGVVLITLKKAKAGALKLSVTVSAGVQTAVKTSPLLTTAQFLALRKEAVVNDHGQVYSDSVPEANDWDPNRQTNFKRLTTGGKPAVWNGGLQANWGTERSAFFLSGQAHRESTVFPGQTADGRQSLYGNWHGSSANERLQVNFSGLYSAENNHLPMADYTNDQLLAPNAPAFKDDKGNNRWSLGSLSFVNIPALANNDYRGTIKSLLGHLQVRYRVGRHFSLEENLGLNQVRTSESADQRLAGQDPDDNAGASKTSDDNWYRHTMTETIARWSGRAGPGTLDGLLGVDYQARKMNYAGRQLWYADDQTLDAGIHPDSNSDSTYAIPYSYLGVFGQVNYSVGDKYFFTSAWRRDKSNLLGAAEPVGNFWTVGGSWVFSRESFLMDNPVLSFGKLRASWGTTGNEPREDLIHEEASGIALVRGFSSFAGQNLIVPNSLPLHWELNHREELALELGFFKDRLFFTAAATRGWTNNQLINATPSPLALPISNLLVSQKGLNLENKALEFVLQTDRLSFGKWRLAASIVLTIPRNRIAGWPGLVDSTASYVLGKSVTVSKSFHWTGVDSSTGLYTFATKNANGDPGAADEVPNKGLDAAYYAGWSQQLSFGNWALEWLFEYRHQRGINPLIVLDQQNAPGGRAQQQLSNGPKEWLDHWRTPGDRSHQQRLTAGGDTLAMSRLTDYENSDAWSIDASYLRLRSVTLSWRLPPAVTKRLGLSEGRISISGQNLWTRTHFPVTDPETQDPRILPPMKTFVTGLYVYF